MRSRAQAIGITAALLGAAALGVPATAGAKLPQFVTTAQVVRYERTFTVTPDALQTVRLALPALSRRGAVMVPCWGFDLTGPGVDLAAASLRTFGWIADQDGRARDPRSSRTGVLPVQGPDGTWSLPEANAVLDHDTFVSGADCRAIGWSMFVSTTSGVASPAEVRRARRTKRLVRIQRPRRTGKARPAANRLDDGSVQVPLAGTRFLPDHRGMEVVVRLNAGALSGPTTITLHGRVLIPR